MANPNIVNVANIYANTAVWSVTTVNGNVVVNAASSNKVYKINAFTFANGNNTATSNVTLNFQRGGTNYPIVSNVPVPTNSTLVALSKDSSVYLLEGDSLLCNSTSNIKLS